MQVGVARVSLDDAVEEFCADDATAAPDASDIAEVQVPIVGGTGGAEQFHALCVGDDFRGVKCIVHRLDKFVTIALELWQFRLWQDFRRSYTFVFS